MGKMKLIGGLAKHNHVKLEVSVASVPIIIQTAKSSTYSYSTSSGTLKAISAHSHEICRVCLGLSCSHKALQPAAVAALNP